MVVIGIIALLVAIVLPSINAARIQAKVAATRAMISVLETGIEQFRTDSAVGGEYPPSYWSWGQVESPHNIPPDKPIEVGGASFVVWALAGADLLGTPGFRDLNNFDPYGGSFAGFMPWADDTSDLDGLYAINAGQPAYSRSGPYVDTSKMQFPKPVNGGTQFRIPVGQEDLLPSLVFLDTFEQPILYYRAAPGQSRFVGEDNRLPGRQGIYTTRDNQNITGLFTGTATLPGIDLGAGPVEPNLYHYIGKLVNMDDAPDLSKPRERRTFRGAVYNPTVTAVPRPHRADSFILISAGPDAVYGTGDDVANFPTN